MIRTAEVSRLLFLCVFFSLSTAVAGAQQKTLSIIDVHAHLIPDSDLSFEGALETAIRMMNENGIATTILMSPPRTKNRAGNYDIADFQGLLKKYPGRFLVMGGGGTLNSIVHSNSEAVNVEPSVRDEFVDLAENLAAAGAIGFGEMGGLHLSLFREHGYSYAPADHPLFRELADIAAKRNVAIDLHMDAVRSERETPARLAAYPNNPRRLPATIEGIERLLAHNRNARIVWAHGGTDHLGDFSAVTIGELMDRNINLFVSLKIAGPRAGTPNRIFSPGSLDPAWRKLFLSHPDRFVIGTDGFYAGPEARGPLSEIAARTQHRLRATRAFLRLLPPELAGKFARDNAIRIYGLTTDQAPARTPAPKTQADGQPNVRPGKGKCRDGNLEHCRIACQRGQQRACRRLKRQ